MKLPPHSQGHDQSLDSAHRTVVIVGANGTGKTRFAARMAADLDREAFTLSALDALFDRDEKAIGRNGVLDRLYTRATENGMSISGQQTPLERVIALLMHDEMLNLIKYKISLAENPDHQLPHTRLDDVIALWQEIFPDNKVLIESGNMLFARHSGAAGEDVDDRYSPVKLSTGERAVIYYLGAMAYAPKGATVFVDSPEIFLHPTMMQSLWNRLEMLRPDCRFVYTTHDLDFAASRSGASIIWVRNYQAQQQTWDYTLLPSGSGITDEIFAAILGDRKPVLFIEGDPHRSIDAKLYPLIFKDFTVRSLGSCNKVIESTRTFNDLNQFHQLDSYGIVDRDRRDAKEVEYLRGKKVMVPEVAEVENILMLEEVIRAVAAFKGKDENRVFRSVKRSVIRGFSNDLRQQALLHTRHRVKRTVEYRIDGRFQNIGMLENHLSSLFDEINPHGLYDRFCAEFRRYVQEEDYPSILRVYNQKSMLPASNVAGLCGLNSKEEYISTILTILRTDAPQARRIRQAVINCFNLQQTNRKNE